MRNVSLFRAGPALAASSSLSVVLLFGAGVLAAEPEAPQAAPSSSAAVPAPASSAPVPPTSVAPAGAPAKQGPHGVAVLARDGASDTAWLLAQNVYASEKLRPEALNEPEARALMGEPATETSGASVKDLAEMRGAVRGDDAPSRAVLSALVKKLNVEAMLVVRMTPDHQPEARLFLAATNAFDAARYAPDDGPSGWSGTVHSLEYTMNDTARAAAEPGAAPDEATKARDERLAKARSQVKEGSGGKPFYTSPWFWVAVGGAALGVTALVFATRDNSPDSVHLQMKVPP